MSTTTHDNCQTKMAEWKPKMDEWQARHDRLDQERENIAREMDSIILRRRFCQERYNAAVDAETINNYLQALSSLDELYIRHNRRLTTVRADIDAHYREIPRRPRRSLWEVLGLG